MAIPVIENSWGNYATGSVTSLATTISGIAAGDLILVISGTATATSSTAQLSISGYTEKVERSTSTLAPNAAIHWKKAAGGETSVTVSSATSAEMVMKVLRISGADTTSPFDVLGQGQTTSASKFPSIAAITSLEDDTLIIAAFVGTWAANGTIAITAISGHPPYVLGTSAGSTTGNVGDMSIAWSQQDLATAGTSGSLGYNVGVNMTGQEFNFSIKSGLARRIFIT